MKPPKNDMAANAKRCAAMRAAKARLREELATGVEPRQAQWQPPKLRKIIVIFDLDSGAPKMRMLQLWRSNRIDAYRVRSSRGESPKPVGLSRVLAAIRKRTPRVMAAKND